VLGLLVAMLLPHSFLFLGAQFFSKHLDVRNMRELWKMGPESWGRGIL